MRQRRNGNEPPPRGARLRALREQEQMQLREGTLFWQQLSAGKPVAKDVTTAFPESNAAPPPLSLSQWVFIGPQPTNPHSSGEGNHTSGRVTALAVDPTNPNVVYLGAAQGGVWKSVNAGTSWTPLTDDQPSLAVGSLVLDPRDPQTIYVGTGEENFGSDSYYGVGILRSTDGGAHWTNIAGSTAFSGISEPECNGITAGVRGIGGGCGGLRIGSLAASVQGGSTVLLAAVQGGFTNSGGLYRSTDGGASWGLVTGIATEGSRRYTADSVVFANSTTAYAGIQTHPSTGVTQGVYKSVDGGISFTQMSSGLTSPISALSLTGRVTVAAATSDPTGNTAYVAIEIDSDDTLFGFFRTTDGSNWTRLANTPDFCGGNDSGQCFYDMLVAVSPTDRNVVFIGGSGNPNLGFLYHTVTGVNGGSNPTWIQDTSNIHADQHAGAFTADGNTFYIGNDGGAYKTTGIGSSAAAWSELNSTLGITQFYGYFAIDPANSAVTYGGTQDNGTQKFHGDMAWDNLTCGDGAGAVIDAANGRVFANCQFVDVRKSETGSPGSFSFASAGFASGERVEFIPPMIGDSGTPMNLYFGTFRLWRASSSFSPTWSAVTGDLTTGTGKITNLDVSSDGSVLWAVTSDSQVQKIANPAAGASVTNVSGFGYPSAAFLNVVRTSPSDPNVAYLGLAGFGAGQHVYKNSGGLTWTNISGDLPNTPVNDLVIDPDLPSTIYAATDIGVFMTQNDGGHWTTMQTLLPKVAVMGLKLHRGSRILRAATHGRGMWDLSVPACATGACIAISPAGLNFGDQMVGTTSTARALTLTNNGNATLHVNSVTVTGDFSETDNCATVLVNQSCTVQVTFSPQQAFARTGSITFTSNAVFSPVAGLSGNGIVLSANDNFSNPVVIGSLPYNTTVVTNGATSDPTDPIPPASCVGSYAPNNMGFLPTDSLGYDPSPSLNHHSVWFTYTPVADSHIDLTTSGTNFDTVISIWTGTPGNFVPVACNDDQDPGVTRTSRILNLAVTAGTHYQIMVNGYYSEDSGKLFFSMSGFNLVPLVPSVASLNFSGVVGRSSAAKIITLSNSTGFAKLVWSTDITGDYQITKNQDQSKNCFPDPTPDGGSCQIAITFHPNAAGTRNGNLRITIDQGVQTNIPLFGSGIDFSLSQRRPARAAKGGGFVQGQSKKIEVALQVTGDAGEMVKLSCANLPPSSTCTVTPAEVPASAGSTIVVATLQTTAGSPQRGAAGRSLRISGGTPPGIYTLQIQARIGDQVRSVPVVTEVTLPDRGQRLRH